MHVNGSDMFTDPRFADHRAPMTRMEAFRNGFLLGILMGVVLAAGLVVISMIL